MFYDPTDAIKYLESPEYISDGHDNAHKRVFVRPLFQLIEDDTSIRQHENGECDCSIGHMQALESIPWTDRVEQDWLKYGQQPKMSTVMRERHWQYAKDREYQNQLVT